MQSSQLAFSIRFSRLVFLAVALFAAAASAQAQQKVKPQPILIAEWSDDDRRVESLILPVRSQVRASVANNHDYSTPAVVKTASKAVRTVATHYKSAARFAYLQPTALEQKAFDLINEQRRQQNLPALEWDLGMLYVAREHSANMARLDFFAHKDLDGKTADDRAKAAGISDWRMIGENIAYNQGVKNTVDFAVECWMKSPGHKTNLLGKKWTRSGIGVAVTPAGRFYITQVFRN